MTKNLLVKYQRQKCLKVLVLSALVFFFCAFIVYSNTRFNGFADVKPFSHYICVAKAVFEKICAVLFNFSKRFLY